MFKLNHIAKWTKPHIVVFLKYLQLIKESAIGECCFFNFFESTLNTHYYFLNL